LRIPHKNRIFLWVGGENAQNSKIEPISVERQEVDFGKIVRLYGPSIYDQARRILGNRQDAEEATQDAFLTLSKDLPKFRGKSRLSTWIYTLTKRVCLKHLRKPRHVHVSVSDDDGADMIADPEPDPAQALASAEGAQIIARLISRLPGKDATAAKLFFLDRRGYLEISADMNLPRGTVATMIHRSRKCVRTMLLKANPGVVPVGVADDIVSGIADGRADDTAHTKKGKAGRKARPRRRK